jgi:hypothetical protein
VRSPLLALLIGVLAVSFDATAEEQYPELVKRVPHLTERLRTGRWEARYCLLSELSGRDSETKSALEALVRDSNEAVANQAVVRYVGSFLKVDRALFRPALYVPHRFPLADLPAQDPDRALVEYCLGRRKFERSRRDDNGMAILPVLDAASSDDPRMHETLTIVGMLGRAEDADALYPFLQSTNAYVAIGAAKAVLRLGQQAKGVEALLRLTQLDTTRELPYVTEALRLLKELNHPGLDTIVRRVLASVDRGQGIQPNWVSEFLLVAADIAGPDVWTPQAASGQGEGPK